MIPVLIPPAKYIFLYIPLVFFSILIPLVGVAVFTYMIALKTAPLVHSALDHR